MNKKISKLLCRLMLLPLCLSGQTNTPTNVVFIPWENGRVSILLELDPVWIITKKGTPIKNVRLKEIRPAKGIVVYEKEKCLHDLPIQNISRITAGYESKSAIFFDENNNPLIKIINSTPYGGESYSDFQYVNDQSVNSNNTPQKVIDNSNLPPVSVTNNEWRDTIIKNDGETLAVKILEITPGYIKFKKLNNMEGPSYVLENNFSVKIIRKPDGLKITIPNK